MDGYKQILDFSEYKKAANDRGLRCPRNGGNIAFLMCGAPGAGKSTRAAWIANQIDGIHISIDAIREKLYGSAHIQGNYQEIEEVVTDTMDKNLDKSIILDATHYSVRYRNNARYHLEKRGYNVVLVVVDTPLEECIRRNEQRDRVVPENVVRELHQRYSSSIRNLHKEEYYDVVILK